MPEGRLEMVINRCAYLRRRLLPLNEFERLLVPVHRRTLLSLRKLRQMYQGVVTVIEEGVRGDVVECGCARGGSAAFMGRILQARGELGQRCLWLFDTFEGLPAPNANDPDFEQAKDHEGGCLGTLEDVSGLFRSLGLVDDTRFVKGLFQDTLKITDTGPIAFLHLDGDWYDSTMAIFQALYDRVTAGGFIQIDDYHAWEGCRRATDEFLAARGGGIELQHTGCTAAWFRKPDRGPVA